MSKLFITMQNFNIYDIYCVICIPQGCGMGWRRGKFSLVLVALQIVFIILFAVLVEYSPGANAKPGKNAHNSDADYPGNSELNHYYSSKYNSHVAVPSSSRLITVFNFCTKGTYKRL